MCNRYIPPKRVKVRVQGRDYEADFQFDDVRPTDPAPIVIAAGIKVMRWGWRVPWDKKPITNAKSETVTTLATFKDHVHQRCVIVADGFYEKGVLFRRLESGTLALAGLWRTEGDGDRFTMLTTTPNETVAPYHDRMPFVLHGGRLDQWLSDGWSDVLANPDRAPLEKIMKQPNLF